MSEGKKRVRKLDDLDDTKKSSLRANAAVKAILRDVARGVAYSRIRERLIQDEYGLNFHYAEYTAEQVIAQARRILKEEFKNELPELKEKIVANLWDIVEESRNVGDRASAISATKEIGKLVGVYAQESIKLQHDGAIVIDFGTKDDETNEAEE
jgi:hypothetical protein